MYLYENGTMKPVEIVLISEGNGCGRMMEGVNLTKVHYKYVWKCHNETPVQL
jgi:predicted DNA-binding antitoxin AbrB/MazE fold protein